MLQQLNHETAAEPVADTGIRDGNAQLLAKTWVAPINGNTETGCHIAEFICIDDSDESNEILPQNAVAIIVSSWGNYYRIWTLREYLPKQSGKGKVEYTAYWSDESLLSTGALVLPKPKDQLPGFIRNSLPDLTSA